MARRRTAKGASGTLFSSQLWFAARRCHASLGQEGGGGGAPSASRAVELLEEALLFLVVVAIKDRVEDTL